MTKIKCPKCGYEWFPRTENPKACPNCKQYIRGDRPKSTKREKENEMTYDNLYNIFCEKRRYFCSTCDICITCNGNCIF